MTHFKCVLVIQNYECSLIAFKIFLKLKHQKVEVLNEFKFSYICYNFKIMLYNLVDQRTFSVIYFITIILSRDNIVPRHVNFVYILY